MYDESKTQFFESKPKINTSKGVEFKNFFVDFEPDPIFDYFHTVNRNVDRVGSSSE